VDELRFDGRVAVITGAGRGVGQGIALELARRGANVAVNYNSDRDGAERTAAAIRDAGRRAIAVQGSVAVQEDVQRFFDEALAALGRIDILVNNAGVQTWESLLELTEEEWNRVIDTNLKGCFLCTQRAGKLMKENGWGRIVNIGSGCNKVPFPNLVNYTASKGGIEMLTKVSALELAQWKITVNCVAPGAIEIERTRLENDDYAGVWASRTPLARVGTPADVARAVAFFASDDAEFITAQTLFVDGGLFSRPVWAY